MTQLVACSTLRFLFKIGNFLLSHSSARLRGGSCGIRVQSYRCRAGVIVLLASTVAMVHYSVARPEHSSNRFVVELLEQSIASGTII